jgi:hypothetical protein
MIDLALELFSYLIKLAETRDSRNRKHFDAIVTPAFEAAEVIYKDYLSILLEVKRMLEKRSRIADVIKFLEERRIQFKPLRMRLADYLEANGVFSGKTYGDLEQNDLILENSLPEFERGILGLLRGGIEITDKGGSGRAYAVNKHTILDLISNLGFFEPAKDEYYDFALKVVRHTEAALEQSFRLVLSGYTKEQKKFL